MASPYHPPRRRRRPPAARTLWALAVLAMLRERPMHPYEMQRVMHQRHTDDILALKRGSLYHAINQLQRDGVIEPIETSREGRRPERTVYRVTPDGEEELVVWMRELISTPMREPSQFMAALAFTLQLEPADMLEQLDVRSVALEATIAALHAIERGISSFIGRPSVLEVEYQRALLEAELAWVRRVSEDLRSGKLSWNVNQVQVPIHSHDANVEEIEEQ